MVLGSLPALSLIWRLWDLRNNVAVMWFTIGVAAFSLWVFLLGASLLAPSDAAVATSLYAARVVGIATTLSIFFFVLEYSMGRALSPRTVLPFLVVPVVTIGALVVRPASFMTVGFTPAPYTLTFGPFGFVHVGYSVLLHLMSLTLLLRSYLVTRGTQQRQVAFISWWYVIAFVTVFVPVFTPVPNYVNPGLFGLFALLGATTYSLRSFGLFTVAPLDAADILDAIEDPVVVLNMRDAVVDFNDPAAAHFGLDPGAIGAPASEAFAGYSTLAALLEGEETAETLTEQIREGTRYYAATTTPFSYGRDLSGTILVLRDVTVAKRRERQLDLLRQVFSRVFRHNVRNELNVVGGVVEDLTDGDATVSDRRRRAAADAIDRILEHTEKARQAERVICETQSVHSTPLRGLVEEALAACRARYPDATLVADVDDVPVSVIPGFATAVENAVENAVEHNPGSVTVRVTSRVADDAVTLVVADDGTGIADFETDPLQADSESPMEHGSGVGLWLIKWYVEASNGEFDVANTAGGARVEMRLERGD
jgi:signal transduction histidine kinase